MSESNNSNIVATKKRASIEIVPGEHFSIRMIQHRLSLGGVGPLQSQLCQVKLGGRVGVMCNDTILIAQRESNDHAVLITGWKASREQKEAIERGINISVNLGKGNYEEMMISAA
jgi:hypothetical protein